MSEFINEFGKENFIIIIVVGIIVLALIVILIIEKLQLKSKMKKQMQRQILNIDNAVNNNINDNTYSINNYNNTNNSINDNTYSTNNYDNTNNNINDESYITNNYTNTNNISNNTNDITYNNLYNNENINSANTNNYSSFNTNNDNYNETYNYTNNNQEVVYVENTNPEQDAKEKLEEVTKKLIDKEDNLIDHTHFEVEQEEKSIISYDELIKASHDIDSKNDKLLIDEGEAAITLEELYKKHEDEQNHISEEKEVKVNNPVFEEEPRKFKNSEVISPVFGFYNGRVKNNNNDALKNRNRNISSKELEEEIQETEDFLLELRKLKSKLD